MELSSPSWRENTTCNFCSCRSKCPKPSLISPFHLPTSNNGSIVYIQICTQASISAASPPMPAVRDAQESVAGGCWQVRQLHLQLRTRSSSRSPHTPALRWRQKPKLTASAASAPGAACLVAAAKLCPRRRRLYFPLPALAGSWRSQAVCSSAPRAAGMCRQRRGWRRARARLHPPPASRRRLMAAGAGLGHAHALGKGLRSCFLGLFGACAQSPLATHRCCSGVYFCSHGTYSALSDLCFPSPQIHNGFD